MFPNIKIVDANKSFITEEILQIFWKNTIKTVCVYFLSDLVLVTKRKENRSKLITAITLNEQSVAKDI